MSEAGETVLDAATGLPELPEGYWWSVEKSAEPWYYRPFYYFVAIKKSAVVEEKRVRRAGMAGWFGLHRVVDERTEEHVVSSYGIVDEDGLGIDHLTPELIRAAAETVLKDLEKTRMTENLLGAYPPKVLKG